jgi:hypothetical protein
MHAKHILFVAVFLLPATASAATLTQSTQHVERAQLSPFRLPGSQCAPQYRKLLKLQVEGLKRLQGLTRNEAERLCATIEDADVRGVDKLVDPKSIEQLLTPEQRELLNSLGIDLSKVDVGKLMRLLGVDLSKIDLRQIKAQCRQSQGALDSFATEELGRLEKELLACDDQI